MKSLSFIAVAFIAAVNAATVTFKVIAPDAEKSVQVSIGGNKTTLTAEDGDVPYYTGSADLPSGSTYQYVSDGTAETFTRTLNGSSSTRNEFFNRPVTYATNIPQLPTLLSNGSWTHGSVSDPIWDSNYIPSIFVTGNSNDMNDLIENVPTDTFSAKITFIGPDNVTSFEDCTFGLHKPGRKNNDAKQTWVWSLPDGKTFADRSWFKIRHQEEDPTQIREKLYADIARKMGTYANEANTVRFFINKEGMGTFNMLDDVIMYSYINAMFFNGDAPAQMGGLYDGASGATFDPSGNYDSFIPNVESPLDQDAIAPFSEAFSKVDFDDDAQVQAISQYFDYDQFLRFMVMEFLTGSWDAYWMEQTNDGAYIDVANNNMLYYLAQDFDATFGVNLAQNRSFVNVPYTDYPAEFPGGYLINKLLTNPTTKNLFQSYLSETVETIFNNATLGPYAIARHNFLYPDLVWDRGIKQRSPGNIYGWTAPQTAENLYSGVTAPGTSPGGADWGLLEWIAAKENAVKSSLKLSNKSTIVEVDDEEAEDENEDNSEEDESDDDNSGKLKAASFAPAMQQLAADAGTSGASQKSAVAPLVAAAAAVAAAVALL